MSVSRSFTLTLIFSAFASATKFEGQTPAATGSVGGIVVDSAARPIADVEIQLKDLERITRTSAIGLYEFDSIEVGPHILLAGKIGFKPIVLPLTVAPAALTRVELVLKPRSTTLNPVIITEKQLSANVSTGFDARAATAQGSFITAEDIARIKPLRISQVLRRIPTLRVEPNGEIFSKRGKVSLLSKSCANGMPIYIDNNLLGGGNAPAPSSFTSDQDFPASAGGYFGKTSQHDPAATSRAPIDLLTPNSVAGIEIYAGPATAPPNLPGANSACGVILIWTK